MRVESPDERTGRKFSRQEAEAFMRSWYRVVREDGSTVAYVPDRTTAEKLVQTFWAGGLW